MQTPYVVLQLAPPEQALQETPLFPQAEFEVPAKHPPSPATHPEQP